MASQPQALETASLKLAAAGAIVELVAVLDVYQGGEIEGLKKGTITSAMLHAGELIEEARGLINSTEAQP